jgi:hypothetical protein
VCHKAVANMNDKETISHLQEILKKYAFTDIEKEAIRSAIGILSWTKLVEGWVENRKKKRDKKLKDEDSESELCL